MNIFEINLFGLQIAPTYYGLMYALSFLLGYYVIKKRSIISGDNLDDLLFYIFIGIILGGRLGYVVFYNFGYFMNNISEIIAVWNGGMSFHGGVIGVVIAMIIFAKRKKMNFYQVADEVTSVLPIGLGLGRIGNYINGELIGYANYTGPFAMYRDGIGYFPSPLLESFLEGFVLLLILTYVYRRKSFSGQVASLFLIFYGIFRMFVEIFFRQPDAHIGYIFGFVTVGELLTLPMIITGIYFYTSLKKNEK